MLFLKDSRRLLFNWFLQKFDLKGFWQESGRFVLCVSVRVSYTFFCMALDI